MEYSRNRSAIGTLLIGLLAIALATQPASVRGAGTDDNGIRVLPAIPAGVVSTDSSTFFVTNDKGIIEAIDLSKGKLLWTSDAAYRPLAVAGTKLIAQARVKDKPNSIRLVVLDLKGEGKVIKESDDLDMPGATDSDQYSSAHGGAAPGLQTRQSFGIGAVIDTGDAIVKWQSSLVQSGRINQSTRAWGSWRFDLESGKAKQLTRGSATVPGGPIFPKPNDAPLKEKLEGDPDPSLPPVVPESLRDLLPQPGKPGPRIRHEIWVLEGKGRLLIAKPRDDKPQTFGDVVLHRWDITSGKTIEAVNLYGGEIRGGFDAGIRRTPDGSTIIVETGDKEHHVLLFDSDSGKKVADLDLKDKGQMRLLTDGKTILVAQPRENEVQHISLLNAATGQQLGEVDVKCSSDLKIDQIAGIIGTRVYTVNQGNDSDGGSGPFGALRTHGTGTVAAFDASRGELLWKKSFSLRTYVDNSGLLAP